ncbi:acyltransferase, partial [Streptomyces sp. NPDC059466]
GGGGGGVVRGGGPAGGVGGGAPAGVVRRWDPAAGWQPPLRTPAPVPIPDGVTPQQLLALSGLDEAAVARLAELDLAAGEAAGDVRAES